MCIRDSIQKLPKQHPLDIKEKGVYLITGGAGGIGMTFACHLAQQYQAKLVLIGRKPLGDNLRKQLDHILALDGKAKYFSADVADMDALQNCIDWAEQHFGSINGVLHCAGSPGDGLPLRDKSWTRIHEVLNSKVAGSLALVESFKSRIPDWIVFCSSASAVVGGAGRADYSSANNFQNALAQYLSLIHI